MTDDLRLLTVKQPHAWAIVNGYKDVENRTWKFPLPLGTTIGIQAGANPDRNGLRCTPTFNGREVDVPHIADMAVRGVIGFATVVDDHPEEECSAVCGGPPAPCSPWAAPGHRHWMLANAWPLREPIPTRGSLWLHRPPEDVKERMLAALADHERRRSPRP